MVELHTPQHYRLSRVLPGRPVRTFRKPHSDHCLGCHADLSMYNAEAYCALCHNDPGRISDAALLHHLLVAYPKPIDLAAHLRIERRAVSRGVGRLRRCLKLMPGHAILRGKKRGEYVYVVEGATREV